MFKVCYLSFNQFNFAGEKLLIFANTNGWELSVIYRVRILYKYVHEVLFNRLSSTTPKISSQEMIVPHSAKTSLQILNNNNKVTSFARKIFKNIENYNPLKNLIPPTVQSSPYLSKIDHIKVKQDLTTKYLKFPCVHVICCKNFSSKCKTDRHKSEDIFKITLTFRSGLYRDISCERGVSAPLKGAPTKRSGAYIETLPLTGRFRKVFVPKATFL
uniref:Uncharacterized protein n=1 Tax=Megaselia scalaris TaxID=36166 RepID=T1GER9_MEGSC